MNMQTSSVQITVIFLIVCALLLGIAIGGFIASLRQGKKPDVPESESQTMPDRPSGAADAHQGWAYRDLIRLRKDPESEALEVVLAGQTFRSATEMSAVQRTLAGYAANDLRAWLNLQAAPDQTAVNLTTLAASVAVAPSVAEAGSETTPVQITVTAQPVAASPGRNGKADLLSSEPAENDKVEDPKKRKRGRLMGVITRALGSDVPSVRLVTKSIAVQVNQILHDKLKDTPLESRGICLMELPGQEMVVMIGLDKYDSVSAVPDEEIRAVLQSAVNEWLARSTP
jgi:hypothetical protein